VNDSTAAGLKISKLGALLALLTILAAFGMGAAFGLCEKDIKGHLKSEAEAVKDSVYKDDKDNKLMDATTDKSWKYCKRAHVHAAGLGAIALAITLYLGAVGTHGVIRFFGSVSIGLGALGYSVFWALAALKAPGMGDTGAAKESLFWLAQPATGLCILGVLFAFLAFLGHLFGGCCRRQE